MSRIAEVVREAAINPVEAIQVIVALVVFVLGIYIASPFFVSTSTSPVALAFSDNLIQQFIVGMVFAIPTLPIIFSLFFRRFQTVKWYTRSTIFTFGSLLFISLLRVITIGFTPVTWVLTLGLALIIGVCHLYWKAK